MGSAGNGKPLAASDSKSARSSSFTAGAWTMRQNVLKAIGLILGPRQAIGRVTRRSRLPSRIANSSAEGAGIPPADAGRCRGRARWGLTAAEDGVEGGAAGGQGRQARLGLDVEVAAELALDAPVGRDVVIADLGEADGAKQDVHQPA